MALSAKASAIAFRAGLTPPALMEGIEEEEEEEKVEVEVEVEFFFSRKKKKGKERKGKGKNSKKNKTLTFNARRLGRERQLVVDHALDVRVRQMQQMRHAPVPGAKGPRAAAAVLCQTRCGGSEQPAHAVPQSSAQKSTVVEVPRRRVVRQQRVGGERPPGPGAHVGRRGRERATLKSLPVPF